MCVVRALPTAQHGRWRNVLMVSEGPACKRAVTDKSLEHGRRNRTDLAANCFPRGPGVQYARHPRHEQWAWRARLGSPWENPNSQWQEFKHKLACNRHMTEHLRGCRELIIIGDGDSNPYVWSAVVKQPHIYAGPRSTSLRGWHC